MRLSDLQSKDIVNIDDGKMVGSIIDVLINSDGSMNSLIVERGKFFKLSHGEIEIKWSQVKKIGEDVILVSISNLWYYLSGDRNE